MDLQLDPQDLEIIQSEEQILENILSSFAGDNSKATGDKTALLERFKQLRDEATRAKPEDLPTLFDQMNSLRALMEREEKENLIDTQSPYFAHMQLEENGKVKHVLLGHKTYLEVHGLPIIDWRHAPISKIFFNYREGEEYEEELPGRLAIGTVKSRRVLTIDDGVLRQIIAGDKTFRKDAALNWQKMAHGATPMLAGGAGSASRTQKIGTGQTHTASPDIAALLDPEQFEILNADLDDPLLILGGAGCGKTTVALHRIALLHFRDKHRFAQKNMAVIVPEPGLMKLSRRLLDSLNLFEVDVITFDMWINQQARRMISGLPRRVNYDAPSDVIRFKRHPAIKSAFSLIVAQNILEIKKEAKAKLPSLARYFESLSETHSAPLIPQLNELEVSILNSLDRSKEATSHLMAKNVRGFFKRVKKRVLQLNQDRHDLFANESIIESVISAANGQLPERIKRAVLSHSLDQLTKPDQGFGGYADQSRLETLDGRSLADEELDSVYQTIDAEDFAILIELYCYKTGIDRGDAKGSKLASYSHLVIDEAQGLAPIELNVIQKSLQKRSAVTIAGDAAQQVDPAASFENWKGVLTELGLKQVSAKHLKTTYRSTAEIAMFAHKALGPLAPAEPPISIKTGAPVTTTILADEGPMSILLNEALQKLMIDEPSASVAIITKSQASALRLYKVLKGLPKIRYVEKGDFEFRPGIDVTTADQVKGLEFDYVIIADATSQNYEDRPEHRRLFHVAATRAIHQLWVIAPGAPSVVFEDAMNQ